MKNTLLLGNGFSQSIYNSNTSWGDLYSANQIKILLDDYPLLYEAYYIRDQKSDDEYKGLLMEQLKKSIKREIINDNIVDINDVENKLKEKKIGDILTTNYDNGIEFILEKNKFSLIEQEQSETIYSIRRKKVYKSENQKYKVNLWKIHGDIEHIPSVSLGLDQYCGSIGKMNNYIKGNYKSEKSPKSSSIHFKDKFNDPKKYDGISWIEKFFNTNVYIAGLGMYFSETDLWWLLNKRARFIKEGQPIKNKIVYLYSYYDVDTEKKIVDFYKKKKLLEIFKVEVKEMKPGDQFLRSLFSAISRK